MEKLRLEVLLAGVDKLSGPLRRVLGGAGAAAQGVADLRKKLKALNDQQAAVGKMQKQADEYARLNNQLKVRATLLETLRASGTASAAQLKREEAAVAKLREALDQQRVAAGKARIALNLMGVGGTQQVMLKVRFAEMQRSVTKSLSSSLSVTTNGSGTNLAIGTGSNKNGALSVANGGVGSTTQTGSFGIGFTAGNLQLGVLLEALESKGLVRTLAEPNLTALSGQEAKFLAGGEYPIPVSQDNNTVTIEYKAFGVQLGFVPRVVDGDIINLAISAAVSSIDPTVSVTANGISVNAFRRREANTTVEMRDGESFAIAGLLQDDFRDLNGQVPWLGDVPILGALFRSADYTRNQSELVIIVTPHLVSPTRGEALALPTDRVRPPSEAELFLFGKTAAGGKVKGPAAEVSKQDFTGPYGYVME